MLSKRKSKSTKRILLSVFSALICILIVFESVTSENIFYTKYHYEVRKNMSIYFSNSDQVIAAIRKCLKRHDWHITVTFNSHSDNMNDISDIIKELMEYAVAETNNPEEGDYIRYQYSGYDLNYCYTVKENIFSYKIEILPHYYTTPQQEDMVTQKINDIIKSFHFTDNSTDYEKFRKIYDYIIENVKYDHVHKNKENNHLKTTAYSALFYKTAVCQGYAVLMYRMLREAGVGSRVITGMAMYENGEEFHAWNIVRLDGVYYNVDITWDKQAESKTYFLKCDRDFGSHRRDALFSSEEFYKNYPMSDRNYQTSDFFMFKCYKFTLCRV